MQPYIGCPFEIVKGAISAAKEFSAHIILTGRVEEILRCIEKMGLKELPAGVEIANATEVIEMDEEPVMAYRKKKDSSMTVGLNMLKEGQGDAMVSAGSTGALLSGATLVVKRIPGVKRAALAPILPNADKGAASPLRYRALPYSPFHGFPDMFRLRDYAMVVPPRPARASFAISMEVMMAWRPFPAFMKSMEASILGSMEPAENWPSFA